MAKVKHNPDLKAQIEALRAEIEAHSRAYYAEDNPTISDFEFDQLMQRLRALEAMAPDLATPDSPSRKVGGAISTDLVTTRHTVPLLSLQDVFYQVRGRRLHHPGAKRFPGSAFCGGAEN